MVGLNTQDLVAAPTAVRDKEIWEEDGEAVGAVC